MSGEQSDFSDFVERARALHEQHPDWSARMVTEAVRHGEDSDQFREATARRDALDQRIANTAWNLRVTEARTIANSLDENKWAEHGLALAQALAGHEQLGELARRVERTDPDSSERAALGRELALKVLAREHEGEEYVDYRFTVEISVLAEVAEAGERPTARDVKYALYRGLNGIASEDAIHVEEHPC